MNWEALHLGVTVLLAGATALGTFFTMRARTDQQDRVLDSQSKRLDKAEEANAVIKGEIADYKLHVAETYVSRTNLAETEGRLTKRLDTVEHTVRDTATKIIDALSGRNTGPSRPR